MLIRESGAVQSERPAEQDHGGSMRPVCRGSMNCSAAARRVGCCQRASASMASPRRFVDERDRCSHVNWPCLMPSLSSVMSASRRCARDRDPRCNGGAVFRSWRIAMSACCSRARVRARAHAMPAAVHDQRVSIHVKRLRAPSALSAPRARPAPSVRGSECEPPPLSGYRVRREARLGTAATCAGRDRPRSGLPNR